MNSTLILTGDVNLLGIDDPALPFKHMAATLHAADAVFGNLECCLYATAQKRAIMADDVSGHEGFHAAPAAGRALTLGGFHAVGNANNQNYGAEAIMASNAELDRLGIAHAGTGVNRDAAHAAIVVERNGVRYGFMQRTSQYWPNNHEALAHMPGVAALKAYTAYQPPYYKDNKIPPNRPGAPAKIITWTDPDYLAEYRREIATLKTRADIVIASHHWGYAEDVLQYQTEIAHAAIDAGADIVMGHGPHVPLAIEIYRDRPVFYGLGSFCFARGNKKLHRDWVGIIARIALENKALKRVAFSLVRQHENTEISLCPPPDETDAIARIERLSQPYGTHMQIAGDAVVVWQAGAT